METIQWIPPPSHSDSPIVCGNVRQDRLLAIFMGVFAALSLATGSFLVFGGLGTIPSFICGWAALFAGSTLVAGTFYQAVKAFYPKNA